MDDFEYPFNDFPSFQGPDLTLWLQVVVGTLLLLAAGLLTATTLG